MSLLPGYNKEQHIIRLFSKGDTRAMDVLYDEYADFLSRVCSRYVGNPEDLHDVLQEAFIRIFTKIHTFEYRGNGSLKAWLTRTVINEALHFLRDNDASAFADNSEDLPDDIAAEPDETAEPDIGNLSIQQITDAILKLPIGYRTVFNLFAIEGKSHKEIAELLNIKPDTSASQFYKAKGMLAKMLKEETKQNTDYERRMA